MTDTASRAGVRRDPPWHAEALRLIAEGNGGARIARAIGVKLGKVRWWAQVRGIALPKNTITNRHPNAGGGAWLVMTPEVEARVLPMVQRGMTTPQIARATGLKPKTIRKWAERRGYTIAKRDALPRGTLVGLKGHERARYRTLQAKFKALDVPFDPAATLRSMNRADIAERLA